MARGKHVEVFRDREGFYRFRLVAANGEKQTASQPYRCVRPDGSPNGPKSKYNAHRGAMNAHPGVTVRVA